MMHTGEDDGGEPACNRIILEHVTVEITEEATPHRIVNSLTNWISYQFSIRWSSQMKRPSDVAKLM